MRGMLVVLASLSLAGCESAEEKSQREAQEHRSQLFQEAEAVVRAGFFDPDSARFDRLVLGKNDAVCGWVNAKNRFGGYVGFEQFVYLPAKAVAAENAERGRNDYPNMFVGRQGGGFIMSRTFCPDMPPAVHP